MTDKILAMLDSRYPLRKKAVGEFAEAKLGPVKFQICSFEAAGLGSVSVMKGSGLFGLMKMDTIIVNPFARDMALFSCDRIFAMGKDILFLEMFDTRLKREPISDALKKIMAAYADIPEEPAAPNWYDDIRLEGCKKKGKKELSPRFDAMTREYVEAYLEMCAAAPACDREEKRKAAQVYTEGLLNHGGPSTGLFIKTKGLAYTQKLYREVMFGTGEPTGSELS